MSVLAFLAAALVSAVLTPVVIRAATARKLYDMPRRGRHGHRRPVPRVGGIAVFVATTVGLVVVGLTHAPSSPEHATFMIGLWLGGAVQFAAGLADDLRDLRPRTKLAAQVVAALVAYACGARIGLFTVGSASVPLGPLSLPVTLLWIVGVANAFNLIDGLDGLATGIGIVALATLGGAATMLGNTDVALIAIVVLGALAGFLRYNYPAARIFLGDSGSQFIGFMLAVLALRGSVKTTAAVLVVIPLSALAVPLLDLLAAIARRWLRGAPIFSADARHIHHRLLAIGVRPHLAAAVLCTSAAAFALLGLAVAFSPSRALLAVTAVGGCGVLLLVLFAIRRLDYHEFIAAWSTLYAGFVAARHMIRDQIAARELAQLVAQAPGLSELNALLSARAGALGFASMRVERATELAGWSPPLGAPAGREWRLDYVLVGVDVAGEAPYVLRTVCDLTRSYRPYGAERVSRVLAPSLEAWLRSQLGVAPAPAASPAQAAAPAPAEHDRAAMVFERSTRRGALAGDASAPDLLPP